jgi:O-antigen ligase
MHTNPLLGTGYESFWLGPRLDWVWQKCGAINEAHNGFLEVYLNLGSIGLLLIVGFMISSYRTICRRLSPFSNLGSLSLALWTVLLFRNATEASFRGGLLWLTFLLVAIVVPRATSARQVSPAKGSSFEKSPFELREATTV